MPHFDVFSRHGVQIYTHSRNNSKLFLNFKSFLFNPHIRIVYSVQIQNHCVDQSSMYVHIWLVIKNISCQTGVFYLSCIGGTFLDNKNSLSRF